jgi:hypothetical protein
VAESEVGVSSSLYDGRAKGLLEFLEYVGDKGLLARQTARSYRSACSMVLAIDGQGWEETDVRDLDVGHQIERFIRVGGSSAKPATLAIYEQRVRSAIDLYREFLDSPVTFRGRTGKRPAAPRREVPEQRPQRPATPSSEAARLLSTESATLVTYPFPLRTGAMAYLQLPRDLHRSDVKRLCGFLENLAIDAAADAAADSR